MKENPVDIIKAICEDTARPLVQTSLNGVKSYLQIPVLCKDLKDWNSIDIRQSQEYGSIFSKLTDIKGPTLYFFEVVNGQLKNEDIYKALLKYKEENGAKATPAVKMAFSSDTKILYLGKVKKNIWGRLIQHLGYYKEGRTQGLQLFYWGKDLCLDLIMHIYEFEKDMEDLVGVVEYRMAKELKPLLGKHK